jgi:putative DNA primase/helicase
MFAGRRSIGGRSSPASFAGSSRRRSPWSENSENFKSAQRENWTGAGRVNGKRFPWEIEEDARGGGFSDVFNAKQLVALHGAEIRFCGPWKKWLSFDGTRWARDESGDIERRAKDTIESFYAEAAKVPDKTLRKALREHALKSESAGKIASMISLAKSELPIPILPEALDQDPWLLNAQNGTVDLATGKMRPHSLKDFITRVAGCAFDPDAGCPMFERFLSEIFKGDRGLIAFIQKLAGYSLTGSTREQILVIEYGSGRNGKSTFQRILQEVLGEYAASTPSETLLARYGDDGGASNDLARLYGIRFVSAIEAEDGRRLAEARIKQVTGGDRIAARFLYGEFFEFEPQFKLWLATNHKPEIRGTDEAIWRRIRLIPFEHTIQEENVDPDLLEKLRLELPGILAWAVRGCLLWQQEGLAPPEKVRSATATYREEQDLIAAFVRDRCVTGGETLEESAGALFKSFKSWCDEQGEKSTSSAKFGRRLGEAGFKVTRKNSGNFRKGIRLLSSEPSPPASVWS